MIKKHVFASTLFLFISINLFAQKIKINNQAVGTKVEEVSKKWSVEKATNWYSQQNWIIGANFLPSTAINQLEMWQEATFDTATINKELGWAQDIGFNTMRVYLHSIAWKENSEGFKKRLNTYLAIATKHQIKTIFVFFDDCWNKTGKAGKQPDPKPGIHNSGWVQDPGDPMSRDSANFPALEKYVNDILTTFSKDKRILFWDLYNEPGNSGKKTTSIPLVKNVFKWARNVNPDQPVTMGLWAWDYEELNQIQVMNSDIITYHDYEDQDWHRRVIELLKIYGRPLVCTEYMARTRNSRFYNILPMLKEKNVGAINWGFVSGKSNTIYAWDTPLPDGSQPAEWFHDIFQKDGNAYSIGEVNLIKKLTGIKK